MERQPRRRRRPALSCLECRRRKIKCDRTDPCNHCRANKSVCQFVLNRPTAATAVAEKQRRPREGSGTDLPALSGKSPAPHGFADGLARSPDVIDVDTSRTLSGVQAAVPEAHRVSRGEVQPQVLTPGTSSPRRPGPPQPSVQHHDRSAKPGFVNQHGPGSHIELYKTRTMTSNHWMSTASEFQAIYECFMKSCSEEEKRKFPHEDTQNMVAETMTLLQQNKDVAREIKRHRPRGHVPLSEETLKIPPKVEGDLLVELYFSRWESAYRVLHGPTFRQHYEKLYSEPSRVPIEWRLLICLAIAAGSSLSVSTQESGTRLAQHREAAYACVHVAQGWLSGPLEKDRLCVTGVQIHCLSLVVRQAWSISGDLIWLSTGSLVQTAMQIGLHRDPRHLPPMGILQAEVRRRLWATVVEMAVQASLDAAMPPRLRLEDFDTEAPANIDDEEISETTTALCPKDEDVYTSTSVQRLLLRSLHTRQRIVEVLNGVNSEISFSQTLELSAAIEKHLQSDFAFMGGVNGGRGLPFHRNLLDFLVRRFLIPLHRTFAAAARWNRTFSYSVNISLDSALAVLSPEPDEYFANLLNVGGGPFREGIMCATTVICVELISRTKAQILDGTLRRTSQHRDALKRAIDDLLVLVTRRIRCGETNIKSHLLLSLVSAYMEALEAGEEPDRRIIGSEIGSLRTCYGLLRAQADALSLRTPGDPTPLSLDSGFADIGLDWDFGYFDPAWAIVDDGSEIRREG